MLLPRHHGRKAVVRADPTLTPGALNPDVTAGDDRLHDLRGGLDEDGAPAVELHARTRAAAAASSTAQSGPTSNFQEDHFISLELGGAPTDPRNLWPEPQPRASEVDRIENQLNDLVCSGKITLAEGQKREAELKYRDG